MTWKRISYWIICFLILGMAIITEPSFASSQAQHAKHLTTKAQTKLGAKYVWGTAGSKTFDCSGFVYWVYNNSKVPVKKHFKRSSCQTMYKSLKKYKVSSSPSKAKKGDIILYKNHGKYTHTAIALNNKKMIHASSSKHKVCIANITACKHSSLVIIRLIK